MQSSKCCRVWTENSTADDVSVPCRLAVPRQKQWSLHDFELGHPLGKGKFGRVFVARTRATPGSNGASAPGYIIALKALYKDEIRKEGLELQVRRELEIQMNLR
jgi:aurora kinase